MTHGPLSLSRRHVLGHLYGRCDAITDNVPVYFAGETTEPIGYVDQSLGHYADAFTFHLADDICKKLSAGHFLYSFEFETADPAGQTSQSRITLVSITLTNRKGYDKPLPRKAKAAQLAEAAELAEQVGVADQA